MLDDLAYQRARAKIGKKAQEFRSKTEILKIFDQHRKRLQEELKSMREMIPDYKPEENLIQLEGPDIEEQERKYPSMSCGMQWEVTETGIRKIDVKTGARSDIFCHQVIMPNRLFHNIETESMKVELAYRDEHGIQFLVVDQSVISKTSTITDLASKGIDVSSETSKFLVRYLQDVQAINRINGRLLVSETTSKFGWGPIGSRWANNFVPYCKQLDFDGAENFRELASSLKERGSPDEWLKQAYMIRANMDSLPPRIALAASFASVLVRPLGINPFIVDFWGMTEKGKTVLLMLAASIWADPTLGRYISGFQSTAAGFEILGDVLNSLPMILDDSSNASQYLNFEALIYSLCEGAGKTRSNKALGKQRQTNWRNCILTNGERPLHRMVKQGGAINRVLEIDCNKVELFRHPRKVAKTVQANYGHIGKIFVEKLQGIDPAEPAERFDSFLTALPEDSMEKQRQAAACILLADELATEWIFQDHCALQISDLVTCLTLPEQVSEGQRAYDWLCDQISINEQHFREDSKVELWGRVERTKCRVYFFKAALDALLQVGGYDINVLLTWCENNNLWIHTYGRTDISTRISADQDGEKKTKIVKCICLLINPTALPTEYDDV